MRTQRARLLLATLAGAGLVTLPAIAWAAQPVPGALYTGNSGKCAASIRRECVFKFRVSTDGRTLSFVKQSKAISTWQCQSGGGEAVFGSGQYDYRIPPAHIQANGTFSGASGSGTRRLRITGSFTGSGQTASLKFVLPNQNCHTPLLTLHKQ